MNLRNKLEDVLVWFLVIVSFVLGYFLLSTIFSSNWFWESLKIILPVGLVGLVTTTFVQQAFAEYKKTGKKTSFLQIFIPVGGVFGWYLLFNVLAINPIVIAYVFVGYILWSLIFALIKIIKNR